MIESIRSSIETNGQQFVHETVDSADVLSVELASMNEEHMNDSSMECIPVKEIPDHISDSCRTERTRSTSINDIVESQIDVKSILSNVEQQLDSIESTTRVQELVGDIQILS
jgi:hypothetical protein